MEYKFESFRELATGDGFNYPVDVRYGTIYLGTLIAKPDGFIIARIDTPSGKQEIKPEGRNKFKTANDAAILLHKIWSHLRKLQ